LRWRPLDLGPERRTRAPAARTAAGDRPNRLDNLPSTMVAAFSQAPGRCYRGTPSAHIPQRRPV